MATLRLSSTGAAFRTADVMVLACVWHRAVLATTPSVVTSRVCGVGGRRNSGELGCLSLEGWELRGSDRGSFVGDRRGLEYWKVH